MVVVVLTMENVKVNGRLEKSEQVMAKYKKKYSIFQVKHCIGSSAGKYNYWVSSTDDINVAHRRVATIYDRIKTTKQHTKPFAGYCFRDIYHGRKCKGEFEVRENW